MTIDEDTNKLIITCKKFNGFEKCKGRSVELLYITFIHAGLSTTGIYPEDLDPEKFYFQWPARTKMKCFYQEVFKEGDGDHKFLRCPDLKTKNLSLCIKKPHCIRLTLSVQKLLKLNLPETIHVLSPTKIQ